MSYEPFVWIVLFLFYFLCFYTYLKQCHLLYISINWFRKLKEQIVFYRVQLPTLYVLDITTRCIQQLVLGNKMKSTVTSCYKMYDVEEK